MTESNQNNGLWWKSGVQILSEVSGWIVAPIVLALIFGKMLDAHFGTSPMIFLIFAGVGFLVTCLGIYKVVKKYIKEIQPPKSPLLGGETSSSPDKGRTEKGLDKK